MLHTECNAVCEFADSSGWLTVTMETSAPLIEMDSAVIDKGTEEELVCHFDFYYWHILKVNLIIVLLLN